MKTDNNPEQFHFCTVKIPGVRQAYTYLTGNLVLNEGDWVEIPFGKYNTLRRGQIESVFSCTRDNAPWPPEKSKTVLRIVDPPAKTTPEEETQEQDNDADTEYVHVEKEAPRIEEKPEERIISTSPQIIPEVTKKPIAWKAVLCAALVLASVLTIILVRHNMKSHYEKAETFIITGEYTEAAAELEKVPTSYKEQKLLKSFTMLCLAEEPTSVEGYTELLKELEKLIEMSSGTVKEAMQAKYDFLELHYKDVVYACAIEKLEAKQYAKALDFLEMIPEYPHVEELIDFAEISIEAKKASSSTQMKAVLKSLEIIPSKYDGPFAEEIDALRVSLTEKIPEAEQREAERKKAEEERRAAQQKAEEERIAALKAIGIPYVGMLEKDVNSTWQLGEAYRSDTVSEWVKQPDGKYKAVSWQCYSWYSKETGKPVFQAECRNGVVFNVIKHGGSDCWDGDTLLVELGPQGTFTFNYGTGTDDEYDGDTGAGSGYSLREDYDSPEDLFEDGGYEDLDEAWDEWEEGL